MIALWDMTTVLHSHSGFPCKQANVPLLKHCPRLIPAFS